MGLYLIKIAVSALLIVAVSELAKRSGLVAATLASLPLVSVIAFSWIYVESGDAQRIARLASDVAWLVLPSLIFFVVLPWLLRQGWGFWWSLAAASAATAAGYGLTLWLLSRLGGEG